MKKKDEILSIIIIFISALLIIYAVYWNNSKEDDIEEITYNEFLELCEAGNVDTIYYTPNEEYMVLTLYNDDTRGKTVEERMDYEYTNKDKRTTQYPAYEEFRHDMLKADINLSVINNSKTLTVLGNLITLAFPIVWIVVMFVLLKKQMVGGMDSKALVQTSEVTFSDVIGHDEVIEDLKFIVELIKNPDKGKELGTRAPKGLLLSGQPGTGKTLLAKAIAGEAGVPFLYMNASNFIEMYVGVGAKRVRELFAEAERNKPCIVFIDEIDAVGMARENMNGAGSEYNQTVNALLQALDGFKERSGIFVIAATNRPESLDKALIRTNRFDREVKVNPPRDYKVRMELFSHYLNKHKIAEDVDIENLSKQTVGFTGSDIESICNESGIIAMMSDKAYIDMDSLLEALDKVIFKGNRSKREQFKHDKEIIAYHEAGHAVCSHLLNMPIARASIQSTTTGVGGAVFHEETDTCFITKDFIEKKVQICYAGRVSEQLKFNSVTTGAYNDIEQATSILSDYIEKYGFDSEIGMINTAFCTIDKKLLADRLRYHVDRLYKGCLDLLESNYNLVECIAQALLEHDSLSGDDILSLLNKCTS